MQYKQSHENLDRLSLRKELFQRQARTKKGGETIMKTNIRKGFTIVELVIVIAVIAILAAVLIPTFSGLTDRAKKNAAMQEAKNAYTAFLTEQETAIQNHNLIIQQGDFFFTVKDGQLSDTPYETLDGAKALFVTVTSWSDKDEKGFYFPVTEPPVTPPVTDDPLDSVDDPPPPVTPPEPEPPVIDESWKEKFKESYADFFTETGKNGDSYYAYVTLDLIEDLPPDLSLSTSEMIETLGIPESSILYGAEGTMERSNLILLASKESLEAYAQNENVTAIFPCHYEKKIGGAVSKHSVELSGEGSFSLAGQPQLIQSREELTKFIQTTEEELQPFFDFWEPPSENWIDESPYLESWRNFKNACSAYDDAFFKDNVLFFFSKSHLYVPPYTVPCIWIHEGTLYYIFDENQSHYVTNFQRNLLFGVTAIDRSSLEEVTNFKEI